MDPRHRSRVTLERPDRARNLSGVMLSRLVASASEGAVAD